MNSDVRVKNISTSAILVYEKCCKS